jgi:hypothetical protein
MNGKSKRFEMVADPAFWTRIDRWRGAQSPIPSRAEAVRILCERALDAEAAK